jgi:protein-tyrosine phosphatase
LSHKNAIEDNVPSAKGKVFRLGEWGNFEIPDPYKKGRSNFVTSLGLIEQGVSDWAAKL